MNGAQNAEGAAELTVTDFDAAWKEALRLWLSDCLKLFWPDIHDQITGPASVSEDSNASFQASSCSGYNPC